MPPSTSDRTCQRCHEVKPESEFQSLRGSKLNVTCRPCLNNGRRSTAPVNIPPTFTSESTSPVSASDTPSAQLPQAEPSIPMPTRPAPLRSCTHCNHLKPLDEFRPSGSRRDGHCRTCRGGSSSIVRPRPGREYFRSGGQPQQSGAPNSINVPDGTDAEEDSPRWVIDKIGYKIGYFTPRVNGEISGPPQAILMAVWGKKRLR